MEQFYKCDFHVHSYNDKEISNTGNDIEELSNNNFMYLICLLIVFDSILGFFNSLKNNLNTDIS